MAQSVGDYDGRLHNDRLLAVRRVLPHHRPACWPRMPGFTARLACKHQPAHNSASNLQGSKLVGKTVAGLQPLLDAGDARLFRPLEVRQGC